MLMYIWMCVMVQKFTPSGMGLASHYVDAVQNHIRAEIEPVAAIAPIAPSIRTSRVAASFAR